jgi:hypothetical protein
MILYSFGERGAEVLYDVLAKEFIEGNDPEFNLPRLEQQPHRPLQNLSAQRFIEKVLIPELICQLIINDQHAKLGVITIEEAKRIRNESSEYGIAMFPSKSFCDIKADPKRDKAIVIDDSGSSPEVLKKKKFASPGKVGRGVSDAIYSKGNSKGREKDNKERTRGPSLSLSPSVPTKPRPRPKPRASALSSGQSDTNVHRSTFEEDDEEGIFGKPSASQESVNEIADVTITYHPVTPKKDVKNHDRFR